MKGVLLIDKPTGITSTGVLRQIRKRLNLRRVGHCGTLDPTASGLLVVCVGEGTKLVQHLMAEEKEYIARGRFGTETQTDDAEGEVIREVSWSHVTQAAIEAALPSFVGETMQAPPRVSAIKIDGKRLYKRVRAGEDVEARLEPRPVVLKQLNMIAWEPPELELQMVVGKGFYVRSLFRDLARHMDTAAHVTTLRRTRIGAHTVAQAISPDDVSPEALIPPAEAVSHLPTARGDDRAIERLRNGLRVAVGDGIELLDDAEPGMPIRGLDAQGRLTAILKLADDGLLKVERGFTPE